MPKELGAVGSGSDLEPVPSRLASDPLVFAPEFYLVSRLTREPTRLSTGFTTSINPAGRRLRHVVGNKL